MTKPKFKFEIGQRVRVIAYRELRGRRKEKAKEIRIIVDKEYNRHSRQYLYELEGEDLFRFKGYALEAVEGE